MLFRGIKILPFEAEILKEIENTGIINKKFRIVEEIGGELPWDIISGLTFTSEENRVTGIGIFFCKRRTLPESIIKLESLKVLSLSGNKFYNLPNFLNKIPSLQVLYLNHNPLTSNTNSETFSLLENLEQKGIKVIPNVETIQLKNIIREEDERRGMYRVEEEKQLEARKKFRKKNKLKKSQFGKYAPSLEKTLEELRLKKKSENVERKNLFNS